MKNLVLVLGTLFFCSSLLHASNTSQRRHRSQNHYSRHSAQPLDGKTLNGLISKNNDQKVENFISRLTDSQRENILNCRLKHGFSPLHNLLRYKKVNIEILRLLLENGADPNATLEDTVNSHGCFYKGWTPVHIAVRRHSETEIFNLLYQHGGNFLAEDSDGWTPQKVAAHENNKTALDWMREKSLIQN
ncbi:MAG: ankyrin repeat domain-containing protein [Myxococcales bacterium]|nr:ankyrin repeat domain-containing protein [Myxococcales bacterium]USN50691.1 MAG: ankyrin repeat domain-containing protein [Myxococcales bacterium]